MQIDQWFMLIYTDLSLSQIYTNESLICGRGVGRIWTIGQVPWPAGTWLTHQSKTTTPCVQLETLRSGRFRRSCALPIASRKLLARFHTMQTWHEWHTALCLVAHLTSALLWNWQVLFQIFSWVGLYVCRWPRRYWLSTLLKHKCIALQFVSQASYEKAARMRVSPAPDVVTRVFMLFRGVRPDNVGV